MITIQLDGVNIECLEGQAPDGTRVPVVVYTDPQSGLRVVIPHDANSGRMVAAHLEGRPAIAIANGIPPMPGPNREQRRHPGGA